ncbi:thiamine pyrophosphate-requiring protein [Nisaea acidiphila]|uniref:Thiamine pyrophosphate-requiring protein n=1 Tax=Nisaea acidiphila TaxID=1862145 RepID=A0A9J7AP92_9PROT|nr:thiamine pyrophosphate-requiring protein [Nisaea acidiphila]UUX49232.1 thiamine pyrophosphate-requiring protein [Nisaea acidiphila]
MSGNNDKITSGGVIFSRLKDLGVDYVFCNSGTDFPPIIEGLVAAKAKGLPLPEAITVPHEHAAMSMAHGYYQISGKCPAVMLHTNVGLSNGVTGAINAACAHVPMLMMSGRTPVTEHTRFGARTVPIGWGQEMRDQAALVRECCKWEFELKFPEQIGEHLDRAYAITNSTPKGPSYLSLPRETLCEEIDPSTLGPAGSIAPGRVVPDPESLKRAAAALAGAKAPLIVAQRGAGDEASFNLFRKLVEDWAIPVCSYWAVELAIATDHPCHIGASPSPWIEEADVIVILDSLAPWQPDAHKPRADATIINIGPDPVFSRFPVRGFRSDITLAGESADTIPALAAALSEQDRDERALSSRRERIAKISDATRAKQVEIAGAGKGGPMSKQWVSHCLGEALGDRKSTVYAELGAMLGFLKRRERNSFFQEPHSGGLGWGFGAALGAQLAEPDRVVVATMGDGSYMFSNPTVCHMIAEGLKLPVITLVMNNHEWGAVRQSVVGLYPDGHASKSNEVPLTALTPSPDFVQTAKASNAHAERVEHGDELPAALERAIRVATEERRQVLLDIQVAKG